MARRRTVEVWTILAMVLGKTDAQLVTGRWNEWQSTLDTLWESGCCLAQLLAKPLRGDSYCHWYGNVSSACQEHERSHAKDILLPADRSTVRRDFVRTSSHLCLNSRLWAENPSKKIWSNHVAMAVSLECLTTDSNIYTVVVENTEGIASRCVGTHAALSVQVTTKCDMRLTVIPKWSKNLPTLVLLYFVYGYDGWGINVCIHEDFRDLQPLSVFIQQHSYQGLAIPGCRRNSTIPTHYHSMLSYEVTASMLT